MIPLSNWLSAGERTGAQLRQPEAGAPCSCGADDQQSRAAEIEEALLRGRREGAEATGEVWEARLAALQGAHAAELKALRAEAGARLSAAVAASIADAVSALRIDIEVAVGNALLPFLARQASQAAAAELLRLIDEDLGHQSSSALEIRAPAKLHDGLRSLLAQKSIACVLTEADDVRLISAQGSLRYESLAAAWIAAVQGNAA